uniref:NADH-ubiquinone oxidoreductase chain 3 n=1 Tax=Paramastax nigra TaxID=1260743 RepID=M4JCJ0_9ORTH|nr:NADH dehydrogenase subunit 3 [Paramastax nigra]
MIIMTSSIMMTLITASLLMYMAKFISKKMINEREKNSPFECGFEPKSSARMPFSLQFFLIAVIFLIFDVEIALILPIIIIMKSSSMIAWSIALIIFILILIMSLYHEWNQGALNWAK